MPEIYGKDHNYLSITHASVKREKKRTKSTLEDNPTKRSLRRYLLYLVRNH